MNSSVYFRFDIDSSSVASNFTFKSVYQTGGSPVLITRARERCVVFSNFKAGDLRVDGNSGLGLKALKTFLEYAENRHLISTHSTGEDAESPFEDSVYEYLRSQGYQVDKQIGCAGFRVDLGIIDPKRPGYYMLGIECDGAKYHSSVTARDRDRLRQQILEGMGWNIYRIWSTDWYHNRKDCCSKLLQIVKKVEQEQSTYTMRRENDVINKHILDLENSNQVDNSSRDDDVITDESISDNSNLELRSKYEVDIPIYSTCISLGMPIRGNIHELDISQLSYAINRVVEVEGPVHLDEVVRRIRLLWGLGRSGRRIQQAIYKAAELSEKNEQIIIRGKFLWPLNMDVPEVRRREDDPQPNIDLICKEEIAEAIQLVLKHQHATMMDDLVIQTSRLLGFQATRAETYAKIKKVVNLLLDNRKIIQRQNGMIDLAN